MPSCSGRALFEVSNNHAVVIYLAGTTKSFGWWYNEIVEKKFYMKYGVGMS